MKTLFDIDDIFVQQPGKYQPVKLSVFSLLDEAKCITRQGDWGQIIFEEIAVNGFTIGFYTYEIVSPCKGVMRACTLPSLVFELKDHPDQHSKPGKSAGVFGFYSLCASCKDETPIDLSPGRYNEIRIFFSLSFFEKLFGKEPDDSPQLHLNISKIVKRKLLTLKSAMLTKNRNYIELHKICLDLLKVFRVGLVNHHKNSQWNNRKTQQLAELEAYIDTHLDSPQLLNSTALARKVGLSLYQFNLRFKNRFQSSLPQYVLRIRMSKAFHLISSSSQSFEEIAIQLGYSEVSSFSRAFKKFFAIAPSSLKRR